MDEDLPSSNLGTKEYWNDYYETELKNYKDFGDEGYVWFGKANVERIIKWLENRNISKTSAVLDIGCGNGAMLFHMYKARFQNLFGIDYAEEAVELAKNLAREKSCQNIIFEVTDLLSDYATLPHSSCLHRKYDIVIDKGTYDAVSLCPEDSKRKQAKYKENVIQLLSEDGILIIISCNWTKEELLCQFEGFQLLDEIYTPSISFGGKSGHTVTSLVLQKS